MYPSYVKALQPEGIEVLVGNTALIVLVSEEGRYMLGRHGHTTFMDATYRVVLYGVPFFILVVVNAQGHAYPAAFFVLDQVGREHHRGPIVV